MKKITLAFSFLVFSLFAAYAQAEKPVLKFNAQGTFKIIQFTDIHLQYDSYRSDSVIVMMRNIIAHEKPDLVMLTGDVVGSDNRAKAWRKVAQVMIDAETPWAAMFGNHDAEFELTKQQTLEAIDGLPYNLTVSGPPHVAGAGNYVLPIQGATSTQTAALCYVLDVSATNPAPENHAGAYEWIDDSQVQWYAQQSAAYTAKNGGTPLPALAFFHIPFPEYDRVAGQRTTVGYHVEREHAAPQLGSNFFEALKAGNDVMGTFVGHQHNNNYIGYLDGIALAFGQTTGRQVYGELGAGARVIVLHEGQRKFDSWIRKLYDNSRDRDTWTPTHSDERLFFVSYPESFTEKATKPGKIHLTTQRSGRVALQLSGSGNATVNWGDGSAEATVALQNDAPTEVAHTYTGTNTRTITINGKNITALDCSNNGLTQLDVSNHPELEVLWCNGNRLARLDLSNNAQLTELYAYSNRLRQLDLSNNPALVRLNASQNQLTELDLSANTLLRRMDCYENLLTALDFTHNTVLHYAVCSDNLFTAEALNAMFATFHSGTKGNIFIGGNPGEADCDRSIAERKGWRARLRY